jgi:hypothetical protein
MTMTLAVLFFVNSYGQEADRINLDDAVQQVIGKLLVENDKDDSVRISRGVKHVADLWIKDNGTPDDFQRFCQKNFIPSGPELDSAFITIERQFEFIKGYSRELSIALDLPIITMTRPVTEMDRLFSQSKPSPDYFKSKLAFAIALNFPYYTIAEKEQSGKDWTRKQWAMVRIGDMFNLRTDPDNEPIQEPLPDDLRDYTSLYILSMDHMLSSNMKLLFPEGTRLNCHNGLRDEIKGLYSRDNSLERQRMINKIMDHIIYQTIPECMIGETQYYWEPFSNQVFNKKGDRFVKTDFSTEADRRYQVLHYNMTAKMRQDNKYPEGSTYLTRTFESRQLSEKRIVELLESVVKTPEKKEVARIIEERLGRDLEPFDIWYGDFQSNSNYNMDKLDEIIRQKYPTPLSFQKDLPQILRKLGFSNDQADFFGNHVIVNSIPSGGHANAPQMKGAKAYLRTRFEPSGMNYKGYRIGMHEIGHTIQQNASMYLGDYYFLKGIPSSPFTEAMADLIAYRNMVGLGLTPSYSSEDQESNALSTYWFVCEMGAEALHEIRVWHWLYEHPDATVEELKNATIGLAKEIWNEYFADTFGQKDVPLFAIYNHFISGALYLHSYPIGNIVLMQLEEYFQGRDFATEMVRMCTIGRLTPDLWMTQATGKPLSSEPLLNALRTALKNY